MSPAPEGTERSLLRHAVATLAYRGAKAFRGAPAGFSSFQPSEGSRSAGRILAHVGDLLDWALTLAVGAQAWKETPPASWDEDVARFHTGLAMLDSRLDSPEALGYSERKIFQGPVADALTHVGQIAQLRRMAGSPVRGESYLHSEIEIGRVGADQPAPRREF